MAAAQSGAQGGAEDESATDKKKMKECGSWMGGVWLRQTVRAGLFSPPDPSRAAPTRPPEPMQPFSGWMKILEMDEKGTSRDEKCINWMNI